MIVVEGPDGAGKTTLIDRLVVDFELSLMPRVVNKNAEAMVNLVEWVEEDNKRLWEPTIYDRHRLISETIYGPSLRPMKPEPGFDDLQWLTDQLNFFYRRHPFIIYCLPPLPTVMSNFEKSRHEQPDLADEVAIYRIYRMYVTRASLDRSLTPTWTYNYEKDDYDDLRNAIDYYFRARLNREYSR